MIDDPVYFDVADTLLQCAADALSSTTTRGAPERQAVVIGVPAHDNCCDGQLTASLMRIFPSTNFPDEDTFSMICGPPFMVLHIDIEIVRCAPTLDNLGHAPTLEEITESSQLVAIDARAVWAGVACCLKQNVDNPPYWNAAARPQEFITPDGGCVGSRLTVYVGLTSGCGCE